MKGIKMLLITSSMDHAICTGHDLEGRLGAVYCG